MGTRLLNPFGRCNRATITPSVQPFRLRFRSANSIPSRTISWILHRSRKAATRKDRLVFGQRHGNLVIDVLNCASRSGWLPPSLVLKAVIEVFEQLADQRMADLVTLRPQFTSETL